ncbi:MAG: deoxyribose-phosphate aldolase [Jaaginema sp. PMC 1079.18]|nr:deoxyribose-phosphate aldolase [Jaaginema sp. PMC 1080.18]MEC4851018.1 deoxyribose-phosphate aldolase [Jaaginema sp. PMC 1079.18]MEC4868025.1 deoxyribose-phosphate aldolase [Jaaginema sp. PMC 1078.18]
MVQNHPEIDLAQYIDHALLQPTVTPEQIATGCQQAIQYDFPTVCVYPGAVRQAAELLHGKSPQVCAVIGFPSGATTTQTKLYEAQEAADNGATELDVVINVGLLKSGRTEEIYREIAQICQETGQAVKAILEMTVLTPTEKRLAAEICLDAGAAFLKTSTGWFGGATLEDVKLLRDIGKGRVGIKASGGIRRSEDAIALILAGATRLGTSRGVELLQQREQTATPHH